MEYTQFAAIVTARGFTEVNVPGQRRFVGTYAGQPFSTNYIRKSGDKTFFGLHLVPVRNFPGKQVLNQLKQMFGKQVAIQFIPSNQARQNTFGSIPRGAIPIMFSFKVRDDLLERLFDTALQVIIGAMNETGAFVPDECPVCHAPGCDAFGLNGIFFRPVHAACVQQKSATTFDAVQQNEYTGSYALGAVGALLGAIAGALPTIFLIAFLNIISVWLTLLIPLGAYYGYKILRGRMTKLAALFVIVASLLVAPVTLYAAYAIEIQKEYHYFLSLNLFFQAIKTIPEVRSELLTVMLFTGLGILASLGVILRGNKHTWNTAAAEVASLRPIQPNQPLPAMQTPEPMAPEAQPYNPPAPPNPYQ